ncbi:E3 ubiquitin/ISG15 ligase TRIM25-like [Neosynchiropus ocellatus]
MAQGGVVVDRDQFSCSICLEVLKDPVTIPCGHSYCCSCIRNYWDQDEYLGVFLCPQCRQNFSPRPVLARSTLLAKVVEKFKESGLQEVPELLGQSAAQPGDVECDVCIGRKNKAVNSCLVCLASYCELHVQPHHQSAVFSKHRLVSASRSLQQTICPRHAKLLEVYCRTDKLLICSLCLTDQHKGHDSVLVEAEVQQLQVSELKQQAQLWIQQREKEAQDLNQAVYAVTCSSRAASETSDGTFAELMRTLEVKRFEVRELIKAQAAMAVSQAKQLLDSIQKEVAEVKKNEAELDKLSQTEDNVLFLQRYQSLGPLAPTSPMPPFTFDPSPTFDPVVRAVSEFKGLLEEISQDGFVSVYERVKEVAIVTSQNPEQMSGAQPGQSGSSAQPQETAAAPLGLDQRPVAPFGPFLSPGAFNFTTAPESITSSPAGAPPTRVSLSAAEMAATTISIEEEQFCCSVCLEVLKDPVTIPCGHSYCLACIQDYWGRKQAREQYSCPQCRQVFSPRPLLSRNTVLGGVVERLQRSGPAAEPESRAAEGGCSACSQRRVESCDTCRKCFCSSHLRLHEERFRGKNHRTVPVSEALEEKLCPRHKKTLRVYCRTDQQGACSQCAKLLHKGHDLVAAGEERGAQQRTLREAALKSSQRLKEAEKELRYVIRYVKHSTAAVIEESERIFTKLIRSIEKHSTEMKELIRVQERAALGQAEELLEEVQRETAELRRTEAELQKLVSTADHAHFLQRSKALSFPSKTVEMPSTDKLQYLMYKSVKKSLAELSDSLEDTLTKDFGRISDKVFSLKDSNNQSSSDRSRAKDPDVSNNAEPRTREDFLKYGQDVLLDVNTANQYLSLSDDQRAVTTRPEPQPYPDHPDRFASWAQVLCRAGMAGRCYWEVEWSGTGGVSIGVCYRSMSRSGGVSDSKLGHNAKSWSLDCSYSGCWFHHDSETLPIPARSSARVGVYLDLRGGVLSFYNVSESMTLLHKVKTAFSQPLYPGFWVGLGSSLKLCSLPA